MQSQLSSPTETLTFGRDGAELIDSSGKVFDEIWNQNITRTILSIGVKTY
jgi:hypothetical protein